jgi:hypothetical protein
MGKHRLPQIISVTSLDNMHVFVDRGHSDNSKRMGRELRCAYACGVLQDLIGR